MKSLFIWTKMIGSSLLTVGLLLALIATSWWFASRRDEKTSHLRWHMVAKNMIRRGAQLREENIGWRLGWVPEGSNLLPMGSVVGKFSSVDIPPETCLSADNLTAFAIATPPDNGAVLPVEVKTESVGALQPGMMLAFVQNKTVLPVAAIGPKQKKIGFELLCVTTSQRDPSITTLMVKVEPEDMGLIPVLGTDQWRPVVLGKCNGC